MTGISPRDVSFGAGECELTFLRRTTLEVSLEYSTKLT